VERTLSSKGKTTKSPLARSYLGIDLSLRNTGVALLDSTRALYTTIHTEADTPHLERVRYLTNSIISFAKKADVLCLEDYAFGASGDAVHRIVELTGILKWRLYQELKIVPVVCNIRTLKKFITGSGKATKGQMGKALKDVWGVDFRELKANGKRGKLMDGEADAYSLALIIKIYDAYYSGQFDIGEGVLQKHQIEVLNNLKMRWGEIH
jgi:Holliday junction resolvasome RuvABC endonuclease subunit